MNPGPNNLAGGDISHSNNKTVATSFSQTSTVSRSSFSDRFKKIFSMVDFLVLFTKRPRYPLYFNHRNLIK